MHRTLNHTILEIRVLEILPLDPKHVHQPDPTVAVHLEYCSLNEPPPFEALSYTWGNPDQDLICVDSYGNVPVRRNLQKALVDLRLTSSSRCIWVDALCINQKDLREREEQVKLMRSIYAAATVVRSWIDLQIDLADSTFLHLHSLTDRASIHDLGTESDLWDPIREIFTNEYWSRIRVQQEIAYAAQWTVQCRSSMVSSASLIKFAQLVKLKQWGFFTDFTADKSCWESLMPTPLRPLLFRSRKNDGTVSAATFYGPLHRALRDCRDFKSSDPKDKIFAMLGMIEGYREGDVRVDYSYSDKQLYIDVAKMAIERHHSLDFLREANLGNVAEAHVDLPTWVPDWSVPSAMELLTSPSFSIKSLYPKTNGLSCIPATITSENLLATTGCRIGVVTEVFPHIQQFGLWSGKIDIYDLLVQLQYYATLIKELDLPVPDECADPEAYCSDYLYRAISGSDGRNTELSRSRSYGMIFHEFICAANKHADDTGIAVEAIAAIIDASQDHFGDIAHYRQESSRGRYLCALDLFELGLIPESAIAGDEIWYILGCPTPMTLRSMNEHYAVVGEAYVNDCMQWRIVDRVLQDSSGDPLMEYAVEDLTLL